MSTATATTVLACAHCGRLFTPARRDAITCSKVCRQQRWRAEHAKRRQAERDAAQLDRLLNCRATTRDGSVQLDGLAPHGVQTMIPDPRAQQARAGLVEAALMSHEVTTTETGQECSCGWEKRWGSPHHGRAHVADEIVAILEAEG